MGNENTWLSTFFKVSSVVFGRKNKLIQVWDDKDEYTKTEWSSFWVSYPFKA